MTIAERIRLTRQQKNISQKELADKSGVNLKSLSRYELDASIPPADALKLIADALGVSADYLLNDREVTVKDKELFKKFEVIQELSGDTKKLVDNFLDMIIRDHKTKIAYTK
jgi:transcriptional regulator with XRE-family HTH domain